MESDGYYAAQVRYPEHRSPIRFKRNILEVFMKLSRIWAKEDFEAQFLRKRRYEAEMEWERLGFF